MRKPDDILEMGAEQRALQVISLAVRMFLLFPVSGRGLREYEYCERLMYVDGIVKGRGGGHMQAFPSSYSTYGDTDLVVG